MAKTDAIVTKPLSTLNCSCVSALSKRGTVEDEIEVENAKQFASISEMTLNPGSRHMLLADFFIFIGWTVMYCKQSFQIMSRQYAFVML